MAASLLNAQAAVGCHRSAAFLDAVFFSPPPRVEGTAVFLTAEPGIVPNALLHNLKHNKVLHEQNLFVTVRSHEVPWIGLKNRSRWRPLGHGCWQVIVHYGFKNEPDLPRALKLLKEHGACAGPDGDQLLPVARHRGTRPWAAAWRRGVRSCLPTCTATPPLLPIS